VFFWLAGAPSVLPSFITSSVLFVAIAGSFWAV
jgi:hypothetical protein